MANKKRYVTTISFYTYADDNQDAFDQSQKVCDEMKGKLDNQASVDSLHSQPFATLGSEEINISDLKYNEPVNEF